MEKIINKFARGMWKVNRIFLVLITFSTLVFIGSTIIFSLTTKRASDEVTRSLVSSYLEEIAEREVAELQKVLEKHPTASPMDVGVGKILCSNQVKYEDNQVYCRLFDREGNCLAGLEETDRDKTNVYRAWKNYGKFPADHSIDQVISDWKNGKEGYVVYEAPECITYFYYKPVPKTEWILGVRLRHSIIEKQVASSTKMIYRASMIQLLIVIICMTMFFFIMMRVMHVERKKQYEKEKEEVVLRQQHAASKEKLYLQEKAVRREQEQQKALRDALQQAERANRAKTTFLSNMSHDIRTPMNAIIGFTDLAIKKIDNTEKLRDYLQKIQTASDHLLSLINDILDMSRIESGNMRMDKMDCSLLEILRELKDIFHTDMKSRELNFYIDTLDLEHLEIHCDKLRLNQILLNCLSNAMKFTLPGGCVSLQVRELGPEKDHRICYQFKITDTGIGMSKEFLEHIFEPFERERTSTVSGIQGTGLGMAITKNIVDMMEGTIQVESEEGKGTEFVIEIPFEIAEGVALSVEESSREKKGHSILLVEDNELNMEIAKELLEEEGFRIETAKNGAEAVNKLKESTPGKYDLVLMDVQMPIMDGYEATRQIRRLKDREKAQIPIIAMTANAFAEDKRDAFEAGMNEHVAKPLELDVLMEAIEKTVG